jgi:DNA (cytosine-5)-methyltransferase 1
LNVGSLFSGIGGVELGFEREGHHAEWFVECEPYAQAVLRKNFPGKPIFEDVEKVDFRQLPRVDILTGGFPCQDASVANINGKGISGAKTGLWKHFKRAISEIRPRYVLIENVPNLLNRGFERVLCDLAEIGYDAQWTIIRAGDLGYPHHRDRLFILAYPNGERSQRIYEESSKVKLRQFVKIPRATLEAWFDQLLESPLHGTGNGFPDRVDRVRCTGNAVVADVAQIFARKINEIESY